MKIEIHACWSEADGPWTATALLIGQLTTSSIAGYTQDVAAYLRFCEEQQLLLDAASLARWRTYLAHETTLSPYTINRRLAAVRRVAQEAAVQGYLDPPTAEAFHRVQGIPLKALKERIKTLAHVRLTSGQMRLLCDAPDRRTVLGWRDRALLHTLATSGCRVSEVVTLQTGQLVSREGSFFLEVLGKNQTTPRPAPLSAEAYASIHAWLARRPVDSPYLFTGCAGQGARYTAQPLHRSTAWDIVRRYAQPLGLQHVSPHSFRRFVGTELAKRDIRQAQKALGHARIETTARHYVLDELTGGLTDGLF